MRNMSSENKKRKMNKNYSRRTGIGILIAVLFVCILTENVNLHSQVFAAEDGTEAELAEVEEILTETDDATDIVELINDNWEGDYEENPEADDTYQLKRLMVLTSGEEITCTYGASDIIYYEDYSEYILQFDTEEDTEYAYYELVEDFGDDNCFIDQVVTADVLSDVTGIEAYTPLSWGGSYMGLNYLKAEYDYYEIDSEVTVAVIDTGVDTTDSIFDGRIDTRHSFYFQGSTEIETSDSYTDENGHGTHVTGIIVDNTPENVSIMVLKTFDADGNSTNLAIRTALQYAVDNGADVVNMSLGWTGTIWAYSTYLEDVLEDAEENGTIICCAAGNSKANVQNTYPANQENVITVSAINSSGAFAMSYSNYGSTVDFCAPGTSIKSTYLNGTTEKMSGTSMATPHMTAAVAYVKMLDSSLDLDGVMDVLKSYAVDGGDTGWDEYYGYGYVNLKYYFDDSGLVTKYTDYDDEGNLKEEATASFSKSEITKTYGDSDFLYSVTTDSSGKVSYSSSDTSVAETDRYGYIIITGAGTCTITANIQADETYQSTTASFTLVVNPLDLSDKEATLTQTSYTYAGKACKPLAMVDGLTTNDYSMTYKNNNKPGTATCIVTGKGNYTGTIEVTFTIKLAGVTSKAVSNKNAGVKITWEKVVGAKKYKIYRKVSGGSWKKIAVVSGEATLKYVDKTAKADKLYSYKVCAVSGSQTGAFSDVMTIRRLKTPKYTVKNVSSGVQIKWSSIKGASKYYVYRKSEGGSYTLIATTNSTKYVDKKAVKGKFYTYTVKAVKGNYTSNTGKEISIYRIKPVSVDESSNDASGQITLAWTKSAKATGYVIQYSTDGSFKNSETITIKGRNNLTTVIDELEKGNTYYIRVRSYKKYKGEMYYSVWSSKVSVKVAK